MYAAIFTVFGFGYKREKVVGDTLEELAAGLCKMQDIRCLYRQAKAFEEDKKCLASVKRLGQFLDKYSKAELTIDDFRKLKVNLTVGEVRCDKIIEGTEEQCKAL